MEIDIKTLDDIINKELERLLEGERWFGDAGQGRVGAVEVMEVGVLPIRDTIDTESDSQ